MKLSVLANLYGSKSLDETLSILSELGIHTVEIGAGGYPGKAHCNPAELLADEKKYEEFANPTATAISSMESEELTRRSFAFSTR